MIVGTGMLDYCYLGYWAVATNYIINTLLTSMMSKLQY